MSRIAVSRNHTQQSLIKVSHVCPIKYSSGETVILYRRREVDLILQSCGVANVELDTIKKFEVFNKNCFLIGTYYCKGDYSSCSG